MKGNFIFIQPFLIYLIGSTKKAVSQHFDREKWSKFFSRAVRLLAQRWKKALESHYLHIGILRFPKFNPIEPHPFFLNGFLLWISTWLISSRYFPNSFWREASQGDPDWEDLQLRLALVRPLRPGQLQAGIRRTGKTKWKNASQTQYTFVKWPSEKGTT